MSDGIDIMSGRHIWWMKVLMIVVLLTREHGVGEVYVIVNLVFEPVSSAPVSRSQPSFFKALSCFLRSVEDAAIERSKRVKLSSSVFSLIGLSC